MPSRTRIMGVIIHTTLYIHTQALTDRLTCAHKQILRHTGQQTHTLGYLGTVMLKMGQGVQTPVTTNISSH